MREIKFRAWDSKNNIMITAGNVNGYLDNIENDDMRGFYERDEWWPAYGILGIFEYFQDCVNDDDLTVEQYTGLKDKNGVEIYEGDILGWDYSTDPIFADAPPGIEYGVVSWRDDYCGFVLTVDGDGEALSDVNMEQHDICGNIHENPELLK
jgi:uncharacterized phage protein (TIGR01671 family)